MAQKKKNEITITLSNDPIIYDNTSEDRIIINESKARLIYAKHIKRSPYRNLCGTFLGLFLSCLISVLTADFKDIFGIKNSSAFFYSFFLIATIVFSIFTFAFFVLFLINRKKYNEDKFISELKASENKKN